MLHLLQCDNVIDKWYIPNSTAWFLSWKTLVGSSVPAFLPVMHGKNLSSLTSFSEIACLSKLNLFGDTSCSNLKRGNDAPFHFNPFFFVKSLDSILFSMIYQGSFSVAMIWPCIHLFCLDLIVIHSSFILVTQKPFSIIFMLCAIFLIHMCCSIVLTSHYSNNGGLNPPLNISFERSLWEIWCYFSLMFLF